MSLSAQGIPRSSVCTNSVHLFQRGLFKTTAPSCLQHGSFCFSSSSSLSSLLLAVPDNHIWLTNFFLVYVYDDISEEMHTSEGI